MNKALWIVVAVFVGLMLIAGSILGWGINSYNTFVAQREMTKQKFSQVQNVYQRRADLIPNLVATVQGYAKHEKETFTMVTEARAKATSMQIDPSKVTPAQIKQLNDSQGMIGAALGRLMMVAEKYPELKANQNFLELQSQLEGTENRIAVERREFNLAAQKYNTTLMLFPKNIIAGMFGFKDFPYFEADKGAEKAPVVKF